MGKCNIYYIIFFFENNKNKIDFLIFFKFKNIYFLFLCRYYLLDIDGFIVYKMYVHFLNNDAYTT